MLNWKFGVILNTKFKDMKKLLLCLALMMPILLASSCSKEDEPQLKLTESEIIGTWTVTKMAQGNESTNIPDGYIVFNIKSDHNYSVQFLNNNYIGTWRLDGNTVIGTTLDPITENLTFVSLDGNQAKINYSNSEGDKYVLTAYRAGVGDIISQKELEEAPSYIYNDPEGGVLYIKFRNGHIYTKEINKDGMAMNEDDITYTLSGENITMEMGWQKTKGTINKVTFYNGKVGIAMNFEGTFGIATWLSKTFIRDNNTFE